MAANSTHCIAVIPARGGSKRIRKKNLKSFLGKPIIQYTIEAALESELFQKVIVSTDDEETMEVAKSLGASVPFVRPQKLADDHTPIKDVIVHALDWYQKEFSKPDYICYMLATAPFISCKNLRKGFELLKENLESKLCVPVTEFDFPIQRALQLKEDILNPFSELDYFKRSQDLEPAYHDIGQFYWARPERFIEGLQFKDLKAVALKMDKKYVQDIDTKEDWELAEIKYQVLQSKNLEGE